VAEPFSKSSVDRQLDNCTYCPKMCRHSCPVSGASGIETHTPQSKMDVLNQLRKGELSWTSENADPLWACTGCRQCTTFCEHDNEPGMVLLAGRAEANARGAGHPALRAYAERFQKRDARLANILRDHVSDSTRCSEGDVGFWPGCDAVGKGISDMDAALSLFSSLGGAKVCLVEAEQVCAGYPLLAAGYPDMFRWHAQRVAESLNSFKTIITNCSACIFTMRRQFAAEGIELEPKILSISEYLAERIASLPRKTEKTPVYYHDPCYLARYSGIIEEPRMVLSRIAEVRDFDWSHTDTECCGGAGLLPKTDPDTADSMARRRLREIANRGGGTVVTSCATCTYMLRSNAPSKVKVVDLATYVADSLT
jgi:Fe-S oxidoreductase